MDRCDYFGRSHYNIVNNGHFIAAAQNLTAVDRVCVPVPLYHCFGMVLGSLACVSAAAAIVFPGRSFDARRTLETVQRESCKSAHPRLGWMAGWRWVLRKHAATRRSKMRARA